MSKVLSMKGKPHVNKNKDFCKHHRKKPVRLWMRMEKIHKISSDIFGTQLLRLKSSCGLTRACRYSKKFIDALGNDFGHLGRNWG